MSMSMTPAADSILRCIDMLRGGDPSAAERLWQTYIRRLVGVARVKIGGAPRRAADEEDVALSAFDSFCRGAGRGQFTRLSDRDDLWQVLVVITERKAIDLMRREGRKSRGEGKVQSLSDPLAIGPDADGVADRGPTPEFAAQAHVKSLAEHEKLWLTDAEGSFQGGLGEFGVRAEPQGDQHAASPEPFGICQFRETGPQDQRTIAVGGTQERIQAEAGDRLRPARQRVDRATQGARRAHLRVSHETQPSRPWRGMN